MSQKRCSVARSRLRGRSAQGALGSRLGTRAAWLCSCVIACSIYEPSLLTGPRAGGSDGAAAEAGSDGPAAGGSLPGTGGAGASAGRAGAPTTSGGNGASPGQAGGDDGGEAGTGSAEAGAAGEVGSGGSAVTGGRGGSAGSSTAGTSGTTGGGGAAGSSGAPGTAGASGSAGGERCAGSLDGGCARLSVPLTSSGARTHYAITLGQNTDFSSAVVRARVYAASASGGRVDLYIQHGGVPDYNLIYGGGLDFDELDGWAELEWTVASTIPDFEFDKTLIRRVGIELAATGSGPWQNPTVVYVDSISVSGPSVGPWNFATAATLSATPRDAEPNLLWMSDDDDEFVPGSTLGWLGQ